MRARFLVAAALLWAGGCAPAPQQFDGPTMGTTYSVTVTQLPDGVTREALQAVIDGVLDEVNRHLSTYDPASEISAFNALRSTEAVPVSPQLQAIVAIAEAVSAESGGAFDITVGPLVRAWGFGGGQGTSTPAAESSPDGSSPDGGPYRLELSDDGHTLRKTAAAIELDVNGIAPGYAVDLITERFDALGVHDYLVELGGEVRARGRSPAGRAWRVAVEMPLRGERKPYTLVELDGMSASTSGDYRDFRIVDGRRVSHTMDPRTEGPVANDLASVCVLHPSAARADAYATALMVLGPVDGLALAGRLGLAALFIEREASRGDFREGSTPEFERLRRPLD
ncbi:MAG: FAD:protein FMN transferase [Steroidobacteraceae bacterium]|nr:FAD:protein FMN transferase [Steroidobacteraceae bacterium]